MGRTYNCEASPVTATAREACHMSVQLKKKSLKGTVSIRCWNTALYETSYINWLRTISISRPKKLTATSLYALGGDKETQKTGYLVPSWLEQDMFQRIVRCYDKAWLRWLAIRTDNGREVYTRTLKCQRTWNAVWKVQSHYNGVLMSGTSITRM